MIDVEEFEDKVKTLIMTVRFLRCFFKIETNEIHEIIKKLYKNKDQEISFLLQEEVWKILENNLKELPLWSIEMIKFYLERRPKEIFNLLKDLLDSEEKNEYFITWLPNFLEYLSKNVRLADPDFLRRIDKLVLDNKGKLNLPLEDIKRNLYGSEDYFKGEIGLMWMLLPHINLPDPLLVVSNRLEIIIWEKERNLKHPSAN